MRGLHRSQRGMPERQLPSTLDRLNYRRVYRAWDVVVLRCLLRISSNTHASSRHRKNIIHRPTLLCYNVMPFGLKNTGATYQRLVTKMFRPLLGKLIEVYIDDMLVKSKECLDHAEHLQEAFELIRAYGMKLNPSKCAFGVSAGRFLGFMVTQRGIEANHAQLKAILESLAPASRKWVQQLTGRLAALGRFISRFIDRLKSFFVTLKGANRARWNDECDKALIAMKQYLVKPSVLASSDASETLFVYLAVSIVSVSAALFKEDENRKQRPIFFVSKSLADAETQYSHL